MRLRPALAAAALLLTSTAAFAADGDKAGTALGAATLRAALKDYLGPLPFDSGFATIEPDPKGYRITLGANGSFTSELPDGSSVKANLTPYSWVVSQRDDGNWQVDASGAIAVSYDAVVAGQQTHVDYAINGVTMSGVYAPEYRAFLDIGGSIDEVTVEQNQGTGNVSATLGPQTIKATATPNPDGNVEYKSDQEARSFTETLRIAADPAQPDKLVEVEISAGTYTVAMTASDFRSRQIADLFAFLLRNADKDKIRAAQAELKQRLGEAMPLWSGIGGKTGIDGIKVKTAYGTSETGRFVIGLTGDGIVTDGTYRYSLELGGMSFDFPQIPEWARPLVPTDLTMDVVGAGVDLDTPLRILLANLDLSADKPVSDAASQEILASFEQHRPTVKFENVRLAARDYDLKVDGSMTFESDKPETRFDIVATGLDKALKSLQDAGAKDQNALQGFAFGSMAKGFGKQLPDGRTEWLIETASDGSVKINGVTIKGPDAPTVAPEAAPDAIPAPAPGGEAMPGGETGSQPL